MVQVPQKGNVQVPVSPLPIKYLFQNKVNDIVAFTRYDYYIYIMAQLWDGATGNIPVIFSHKGTVSYCKTGKKAFHHRKHHKDFSINNLLLNVSINILKIISSERGRCAAVMLQSWLGWDCQTGWRGVLLSAEEELWNGGKCGSRGPRWTIDSRLTQRPWAKKVLIRQACSLSTPPPGLQLMIGSVVDKLTIIFSVSQVLKLVIVPLGCLIQISNW